MADALGNSVPNVPLEATFAKQGSTATSSIKFLADTIGLGNVSALVSAINVTTSTTFTVTIASGTTLVTFPSLTYTITLLPHPSPNPGSDSPASFAVTEKSVSPLFPARVIHVTSPSRSASSRR